MAYNFDNLIPVESGASQKKIYRSNNNSKIILLDFSKNIDEFNNHLKIYNILKKIDISIPTIFEIDFNNHIIVTEDFGDERFDKVINNYDINSLLKIAVESLIIITNSTINCNFTQKLSAYDFDIFKNEISEFIEYFIPYKKIDNFLDNEFLAIWKENYYNLNFTFDTFVHKDFELSNLIYLPKNKNHLKCGIIDFQSAYRGFKGWDLFSLLENSRIYFSKKNNEKYIKYYYENTYPSLDFDLFKKQYFFLNTSRQTRLLGRWVKLSKKDKNHSYLKYIDTTIKRLNESLYNLDIKLLSDFYKQILN